jgi:flavin reductase (DIM6/NTAB) family NADH-FMN oxidoreductase RutF
MPVSFNPKLYAIAVGKTRFSCEMIKKSKAFVVNFIPFELKKEVLVCGTKSGMHVDKFKEAKLTKEEASSVDCPMIKEALGYMECEVVDEIEAGDHIIFIGKILNSDVKKEGERLMQKAGDFVSC